MPTLAATRAVAALLLLSAAPALAAEPAAASTAADQARFLAGLPVAPGSPLHEWTKSPDWVDHQQAMDRAWPRFAERLARASAFEQGSLAPLLKRDRKVIYFFGGPDAAHVVRLFPDAPAYLLAGLEPVGAVQAPETLKFAEVHKAIDGLAVALKTIIEKSFFRTSDMGRDLQGKGIRGVAPVLFIFLARSGAEVLGATSFEVNAAGEAADKAPGEKFGPGIPGVRIRFQFPGRPVQEMSYVRVDLSDGELGRRPGFLAWARSFGPANGFLKAASFILHDAAFSKPRAFLLDACDAILQDDSGVPYRVYKKSGWDVTCFGKYARPRDPFERHEQKDLAEACAAQTAPLDFIIGYRRSNDSALQLYLKRPGATVPPLTPAAPHHSPAPAPAPTKEAGAPAATPAPAESSVTTSVTTPATTPTETSAATPTATPTPTATATPTPTETSAATPAPNPTATPAATPAEPPTPAPTPAPAQ